jgi:superfamily II DNA or RNA helicase
MLGFNYIRNHSSYKTHNVVKLGAAMNIPNRESTYLTGEFEKGEFTTVIKLLDGMDCFTLESKIKVHFNKFHRYLNGGTEFYDSKIENLLIPYLDTLPINYKVLSKDEINELTRINYNTEEKYELFPYQKDCVDILYKYLQNKEYVQGVYLLATGLGKTVIAMEMLIRHLELYPNERILWLTFRNDIVNSQKGSWIFKKYQDKIVFLNDGNYSDDKLKQTGKIFITLRQKVITPGFSNDIFNGVIYDECHDACKETIEDSEIKTYDYLLNMKNLRYRLGFSATPLTNDQRQNNGLVKLYGKNDEINYLYKYSIFEGVKIGRLLPIKLNYLLLNEHTYHYNDFIKSFDTLKNEDIINKYQSVIDYLISVIQYQILPKMVYSKGIIWCPSVNMAKKLSEIIKDYINITMKYSTGEYDKFDREFSEAENNYIMFACAKFTTGFDGKNMEFGVNLYPNESGHITIQKIGRFTRLKNNVNYAWFWQIQTIENGLNKLVSSLLKNIDGIDPDFEGKILTSWKGGVNKVELKTDNDMCAIEINANPYRLDLDYKWIQYAIDRGVYLSINPDAHNLKGIHDVQWGIYAANKGALPKTHCLSCWDVIEVDKFFKSV